MSDWFGIEPPRPSDAEPVRWVETASEPTTMTVPVVDPRAGHIVSGDQAAALPLGSVVQWTGDRSTGGYRCHTPVRGWEPPIGSGTALRYQLVFRPDDPRGDGLCPNCPTDLNVTPAGAHCIECGWSSPRAVTTTRTETPRKADQT